MTKSTDSPITDDQIRMLRAEYLADHRLSMVDTCDVALGRHGASRNPRRVARARARCAEILSQRQAAQAHAEKKSPKQLDAEINEVLKNPRTGGADAHVMDLLERNPGLTEANLRSFLRRSHGDSTALDRLLDSGLAVRRGNKLYRSEDT